MVSRHSAFYSPLISAVNLLRQRGVSTEYSILGKGQRSAELIRDGVVDIMQSAVSSNWKPMEQGEGPLPVHFAQINQRDGFFLVARQPSPAFAWKDLEGRRLFADHAFQPMAMLRYAARVNDVDWPRVEAIDAGDPNAMDRAFRDGVGDYVHLQSPAAHQLERDGAGYVVRSVGASMPPVAFSSLCCSREFLGSHSWRTFLDAYRQARQWVRTAPPAEVAAQEAEFFPGISAEALGDAIMQYQALGCWDGSVGIAPELYEQALNVFEAGGFITRRHAYGDVCAGAV